jgi:hypothetical protein
MSFRRRVLGTIVALAAACVASPAHADVRTFSDTEFVEAQWNVTNYGGGWVIGDRPITDDLGNPGWCRTVEIYTPSGAQRGAHFPTYGRAVVDQSLRGMITSITLTIDARWVLGPIVGSGQRVAVAVQQNGIDYMSVPSVAAGYSSDWHTITVTVVGADFTRLDGQPGTVDFSSCGAPVRIGFTTSFTANGVVNHTYYDNLQVDVTTSPTAFAEQSFADANWTTSSFGSGTVTGTQTDAASGNPGTAWNVRNQIAGTGAVRGFHAWACPSYDPHTRGPVARIDMSIDAKYISGVGGNGQQVNVGIMQGGVAYRAGQHPTGSTGDWTTLTFSQTAADFIRVDGLPGTPDLTSCGDPISFGFVTSNSGTAYATRVYYDNLSIAVTSATDPISDADFPGANWSVTSFGNGSVTGVQTDDASGNPGFARNVRNQVTSGTVVGFHKRLDPAAVVNPGTSGPIASIALSIDARYISGPGANGQQVGLALEQGGIAYRAPTLPTGNSGEWVTLTFANVAGDFTRIDGLPGAPDFSAGGGPVTLGFATANSGGPYAVRVYYDNFSATVAFGPRCRSDFNVDCTSNSTDVSDFINQWFQDQTAGTLITDWDDNDVVNSTDVSEFINTWFDDQANGCG